MIDKLNLLSDHIWSFGVGHNIRWIAAIGYWLGKKTGD